MDAVSRTDGVAGVDHDIHGVAVQIDDRSGINADVRSVVGATERKSNWLSKVGLEKDRAGLSVDGVDGVAFGGDVHHIMYTLMTSGSDVHCGYKQRLTINLVVEWDTF